MPFKLSKNTPGKKDTEKKQENPIETELQSLLEACRKNLRSVDEDLISRAFYRCLAVHEKKVRRSGEPYYMHPLGVAHIVISEIPLDDISVAAALLHDVVDDSENYSIKSLRSDFGNTIAEIVEGIAKIRHIENQNIEQLENYRKFLLAMFKDVRIILIKLADRLHNMRTLEYLPLERQKRIAHETMEVFAPFAQRFGLGSIKWELEDLAFKYIDRKAYNDIKQALSLTREERTQYIKEFKEPLNDRLTNNEIFKKNNIKFEISGRPKHIYSIHNKTIIRGKPLEELYDLFALRIILENDDSNYCFFAYGILSELYRPVPGTFKNYIANPKKNGYQSIHTAVVGPGDRPVEVQIRTRQMHEVSERGVAAHFKYKRGLLPAQSVLEDKNLEQWLDLIRNIFENIGDEPVEYLLESVKNNIFQDEIFVFTPRNEFKTLPKDSTPLDFAYSIHTDIGAHCIGAKVSGRVVPLDYKLQSGDQIEILTSRKQKPSKDWQKIVVTQRAKVALYKYFSEENKLLQLSGKKTWEEYLKARGVHARNIDMVNLLKLMDIKTRGIFFGGIANEDIDIDYAFKLLGKPEPVTLTEKPKADSAAESHNGKHESTSAHARYTGNLRDTSVEIALAHCCYPVPGDKIVAFIDNDEKLIVHRANCKTIRHYEKVTGFNLFDIEWDSLLHIPILSKICIHGEESANLIGDITSLILSSKGVSIRSFSFDSSNNKFKGLVTLELKDVEQLNVIIQKLRSINGLKTIERYIE